MSNPGTKIESRKRSGAISLIVVMDYKPQPERSRHCRAGDHSRSSTEFPFPNQRSLYTALCDAILTHPTAADGLNGLFADLTQPSNMCDNDSGSRAAHFQVLGALIHALPAHP